MYIVQGPTSNHEVILRWAERHSAVPAEIKPRKFDGEPSLLWFLFDLKGTEEIRPISWDDFFARFDVLGLKILFDETPYFELIHLREAPQELVLDQA